jgi:magnesium-transporting ATPase (P-type)
MTSQYPEQPQQPNYGYPQQPQYQNQPQQYQYPQQPYQYQPVPTRRPPGPRTLGIAGLVMGSAALVLSVVWDFVCVAQIRSATVSMTHSDFDNSLPGRAVGAFTTAVIIQIILSLVGTAGLVISIVATATNKGRPAAIAGIVIAAVAPIISYFVFVIALASLPFDSDVWDVWDEDYMLLIPHMLTYLH